MNRIQFYVLLGLSIVVVILLFGHLGLAYQVNKWQAQLAVDQQKLNLGAAAGSETQQLASLIFKESQRTNDPGLKDLVTHEGIITNPAPATNSTETPATPPAH